MLEGRIFRANFAIFWSQKSVDILGLAIELAIDGHHL